MALEQNPDKSSGVSQREFNSMRQNVKLLAAQVKAGQIDEKFLGYQVERLLGFLERMEDELGRAKQGARFEALYNVSRIMGGSLDLQIVLDQVMDAIIQLTGAERGFLMLRDQDGGLDVKAARNLDQQTLDSSQFHYSRTIANQVLDTGEAIVTTNAAEDPRFAGKQSIAAQSLRSIMATPLRARGAVIGVAYVDSRVTSDLFNDNDLNALEALSGQSAIAIENARLFEQTDQELDAKVSQLTQLRRIDRLLNETLDPNIAMRITLEWAVKLANAETGHLGLLEGSPPIVPVLHHHGFEDDSDIPALLDQIYPEVDEVIRTGQHWTDVIERDATPRSVLLMPFLRENKPLGVVALSKHNAAPFTEDEIEQAGRIVSRAAITIDNARLYEAVRAADRAKSEFVGIVAHDLKVPMTSILGYAALTRMIGDDEGNLTERQDEFLEKIEDTVRRMEVLVSDLSDISRIESGHFYMEPIRVEVSTIVEAVRDNTLIQIKERGHTWVTEIADDLPPMYVDYYRLLQVLTNLVSNAYKYTPDGGTVTLKADRDGDRVCFSVTDTGVGLSPAQIAMLGTKFWRAEDEFTRSKPGTGLGFAITASLVELMGSRIKIDSEVGVGSTFSFTVPIFDASTAAQPEAGPTSAKGE